MNEKKAIDFFLMIIVGALGISLWVLTSGTFGQLKPECPSKFIKTGLTIIMVIGGMLTAMSICFFLCNFSGRKCYEDNSSFSRLAEYYSIGMSILSLILVSISGAILGELPKNKELCSNSKIKFNVVFLFVISFIVLLCSGGMVWYSAVYIPGKVNKSVNKTSAFKTKQQYSRISPYWPGYGFPGQLSKSDDDDDDDQ